MIADLDIQLGWYQFYKGNKFFVFETGIDVQSKEVVIIYANSYGQIFVCPYSDFNQKVKLEDGKEIAKFIYLELE